MKTPEIPLLTQVSGAHLVSHLHIMALPVLLPLLPQVMGVGFVELGFAISIFSIVSALVQAPLGFAVDRFGARRILVGGLILGSVSFLSLAVFTTYTWLLAAMVFAGVANGVYHPADYAMLSRGVEGSRMGRAFSIHTFAGMLGAAIAPALLLGAAALGGTSGAFVAAGLCGFVAAGLLLLPSKSTGRVRPRSKATAADHDAASAAPVRPKSVFTPTIGVLTLLFVLLSLSQGSIEKFSVAALVNGYGVTLSVANMALSAFLFATAFGVLAGGLLADRTQRHGTVAASAFGVAAVLVALVALYEFPPFLLVSILGVTGFLAGMIAPSRDMLVRAAAPAGAEGKAFGIVSTGFNIGGAAGPIFFGWLLDSGMPVGVFWASCVFMVLTVILTVLQERSSMRMRPMTLARSTL